MAKRATTESNGRGRYANSRGDARDVHGAEMVSVLGGSVLQDTIAAVLEAGDAILFATTRDGGAVVIQMLSEGATDKLYCGDPQELQETLEGIQVAASAS